MNEVDDRGSAGPVRPLKMEVRPTFEREQKRSAARVQNVNYCFGVRKHLAVSGCGLIAFWADRPRARLRPNRGPCLRLPRSVPKPYWLSNEQDQPPFWRRRFCGLSCWSDLHFSTGCCVYGTGSLGIGSRRIEYRRLSPGIRQFWTIAVVGRLDKTVKVWDQSVS